MANGLHITDTCSANWTNDKMDFTVSGLSYDGNGNILTVKRKGMAVNSIETIDNPTYSYNGTGGISNQLKKVADAMNTAPP